VDGVGGERRNRRELEVFWDAFWSTFDDVQVEYHGFTETEALEAVGMSAL
jgi:hypothetical protein